MQEGQTQGTATPLGWRLSTKEETSLGELPLLPVPKEECLWDLAPVCIHIQKNVTFLHGKRIWRINYTAYEADI